MPEAEAEAVQVAIRVRCFNERETEEGADRIIRMERLLRGSYTYITDPKTNEEKKFAYDYSFQSFSQTEVGIGDWADQDTVFKTLGKPVMDSVFEGKNVCLFAYGQTGSGKSYSMLGKQDDPGIIPRTCRAIFEAIEKTKDDPSLEYKVDIQVVEIYCETVNDLLTDREKWPTHGHKPRFTPNQGYIVDTTRQPCLRYEDIVAAFQFADKNRSIASHKLNRESSRAHTIYTITFERQRKISAGAKETLTSRLNLVDLAGSERTEVAGTSGLMRQQGIKINLSLGALGACIKALSEKTKPNYHDSKLTLLLQDSMTNGKVIVIAAVSPASVCYYESLSTLRFALRCKKVSINTRRNVTMDAVAEVKEAMEKERARLQAEIDELRARVKGEGRGEDMQELQDALQREKEAAASMKEEYERMLSEINEDTQARESKRDQIQRVQCAALEVLGCCPEAVDGPHLRNLNEDERLSDTLMYPFPEGETVIGKKDAAHPPDLEFNGIGITKHHCRVVHADGRVVLSLEKLNRTYVNGRRVREAHPVELRHNDRVWLGYNYVFRFVFPGREAEGEPTAPTYRLAEQEIARFYGGAADSSAGKMADAEKKVQQANMIAEDLGQRMRFDANVVTSRARPGEYDVTICARTGAGDEPLFWSLEKFNERLLLMTDEWEAWQACEASGRAYALDEECNPFVDDDFQLLGDCQVFLKVFLKALAYMVDCRADPLVLGSSGNDVGRVHVSILPLNQNGEEGPWLDSLEDDPFVENPWDLLDSEIAFKVRVTDVVFDAGSEACCRYYHTYVRYCVNSDDPDSEWHETELCEDCTFNPRFKHDKVFTLQVTSEVLGCLLHGHVTFQVWGKLAPGSSSKSVSRASSILPRASSIPPRASSIPLLPPRRGKRGELERLDLQIEAQREKLSELEAKVRECQASKSGQKSASQRTKRLYPPGF